VINLEVQYRNFVESLMKFFKEDCGNGHDRSTIGMLKTKVWESVSALEKELGRHIGLSFDPGLETVHIGGIFGLHIDEKKGKKK